jgi:hypothetical protein
MSTPTWIDCCNYDTNVGDVRYLVEVLNTSSGRTSFSLNERPLRTNRSLQPRLWGWCGETDNRSRHARGVVRIASINKAGDRCRIARVTGADLAAFLATDGYPDLLAEEV